MATLILSGSSLSLSPAASFPSLLVPPPHSLTLASQPASLATLILLASEQAAIRPSCAACLPAFPRLTSTRRSCIIPTARRDGRRRRERLVVAIQAVAVRPSIPAKRECDCAPRQTDGRTDGRTDDGRSAGTSCLHCTRCTPRWLADCHPETVGGAS